MYEFPFPAPFWRHWSLEWVKSSLQVYPLYPPYCLWKNPNRDEWQPHMSLALTTCMAFCFTLLASSPLPKNQPRNTNDKSITKPAEKSPCSPTITLYQAPQNDYLRRNWQLIKSTPHLRQDTGSGRQKGRVRIWCHPERTQATWSTLISQSPHASKADGICWTQSDMLRWLIWFIPNGSPTWKCQNLSFFLCFPRAISVQRSHPSHPVPQTGCICPLKPLSLCSMLGKKRWVRFMKWGEMKTNR